jgi:hypothetical protein
MSFSACFLHSFDASGSTSLGRESDRFSAPTTIFLGPQYIPLSHLHPSEFFASTLPPPLLTLKSLILLLIPQLFLAYFGGKEGEDIDLVLHQVNPPPSEGILLDQDLGVIWCSSSYFVLPSLFPQ